MTTALAPTIGFTDECTRVSMLEDYLTTGAESEGANCETFVGLNNSKGVSCYWQFPFRDVAALAAFDELSGEVTHCKGGDQLPSDTPVNHPDSYMLFELIHADEVYRVAKKDKSQLNRTLVFLSAEFGS